MEAARQAAGALLDERVAGALINTPHDLACPLCSAPIPNDDAVRIDVDHGLVLRWARSVRLTPMEMEVFITLWERRPRVLSREALLVACYSNRSIDEEPDIKIIPIWVHNLRAKLAPLGVAIENVHSRGYWIPARLHS